MDRPLAVRGAGQSGATERLSTQRFSTPNNYHGLAENGEAFVFFAIHA
jgi:hypothetical protein